MDEKWYKRPNTTKLSRDSLELTLSYMVENDISDQTLLNSLEIQLTSSYIIGLKDDISDQTLLSSLEIQLTSPYNLGL